MKILHVITSPRAEGTPRLVLDWLRTSTEHSQSVVFLSRANEELLAEFVETGCSIQFTTPIKPGFGKVFTLAIDIRNACRRMKPEMVICWNTGLSQWVHVGARMAGVKMLLTHAGNPPYGGFRQKYLYSYLTFWIGGLLGAQTVVPSDYILGEFNSMPLLSRRSFQRVCNCVEVGKFIRRDSTSRSRDVIMVATLERHKDHDTLLKAWQLVVRKSPTSTLLLVGAGSRATELQRLSEDLQLPRVSFLGARSDVPELLDRSGVFVLSTTTAEGFGTVLIEALANGIDIVATDVPACREVLQGGKYGTLVPPSDHIHLAEAIIALLEVPGDVQLRTQKADYAAQFTPIAMMNRYIQVARRQSNA